MDRQSERIRQFFKIFNANKYSDQLHIPTKFALYMQGNLPNQAFLSDKFGNKWPVKLVKIESEWYFQAGWAKVILDNSLEHNNIIVFQFDGDQIFYFQIIGNDSCDKRGVGSLKFNIDGNEVENDEHKGKTIAQELKGEGSKQFQKGIDGKEEVVKGEKKRKTLLDLYGENMIGLGLFAKPKNPYFVTKIRPNRERELFIPANVIKDFKLTLPKHIALHDPEGRIWSSYLKIWKNGQTFYIGGWESLCRINLIDHEDKCVCEFLLGQGEPIIQVQIVRSPNVS